MKKKVLLVMMILVSSINYAQNCDCSTNLKWLIKTFEENDAGFQYVVDKKGEEAYLAHNKIFIEKADKISKYSPCHELLNDWTKFFRKDHVYIQKLKSDNLETTKGNDKPKTITQEEFENYFTYLNKKPQEFEGIWDSGNYKIGIKKVNNEKYIGFLINDVNDWKCRDIKFEIIKNKKNTGYIANYYMGDFSLMPFDEVDLLSQNFLKLGFVLLKRTNPIGEVNESIDRYVKLMDVEKPMLLKVSDNSILLRIPSFHPSQKELIDSILEMNNDKIIKTENLILDLRNNGGGALKCVEKILPYLYTNPIKIYGYEYLSTELNNSHWENISNNPDNSPEFRKFAKNRFNELNEHIGDFVESYVNPFSDKNSMYFELDNIYTNPKNIAIIVNENCGSSTEEFLFYAKQSKKVKIFGKKTYGVLDITDMQPINSPSGDFLLYYCTAKSMRLPEYGIDNYGIQPDFYFDNTIKPYEWIKKTIEILNYK